MFNFLSINLIEITKSVKLNWIGRVIKAIIEKPAYSVGVGIILFTLILKLITMPFDIFSRVSSKNNSLKMEKMRPELEKLQKQYKNDKQLYQKKVMALQKKAGYSPLSSCLPSILSIVIFILVINQFNAYSRYSTNKLFKEMAKSYNAEIQKQIDDDVLVLNEEDKKTCTLNEDSESFKNWLFDGEKETGIFVYANGTDHTDGYTIKNNDNDNDYVTALYNLCIKYDYPYAQYFNLNDGTATFKDNVESQAEAIISSTLVKEVYVNKFLNEEIVIKAQRAAKKTFNQNKSSFLWVKNIWVADTSLRHPLESFSRVKDSVGSGFKSDYYMLTGQMKTEKNEANGYFILVAISIGVMFLSQFIMSKEQRSQIELGSVEGKDSTMGQTQKYMKVLMPLMFGVFAFIYTSAFSIYMIISSLFTTLSTIVITKIVSKAFEKKVLKEQNERDSRLKFKNKK